MLAMNLGAKWVLRQVPGSPPEVALAKEPMHIVRTTCLIFAAGNLLLPIPLTALPPETSSFPMKLNQGWAIQSSVDVRENGAGISTVGYQPNDWYPATVPSTVLAALSSSVSIPIPA